MRWTKSYHSKLEHNIGSADLDTPTSPKKKQMQKLDQYGMNIEQDLQPPTSKSVSCAEALCIYNFVYIHTTTRSQSLHTASSSLLQVQGRLEVWAVGRPEGYQVWFTPSQGTLISVSLLQWNTSCSHRPQLNLTGSQGAEINTVTRKDC